MFSKLSQIKKYAACLLIFINIYKYL